MIPTELKGGALMVCGTASDAGKTTVVTGLCRLLAREGLRVAPFKAQNMALNSYVTRGGHEIGRAQAAQAQAAGVEPEVAMNPVLLKPTGERSSQVVVQGRPWAVLDAVAYQQAKAGLLPVVLSCLEDLRSRYDVVICEGAGSPAEINLLDSDIVNLRLANYAGIPAIVVGDIDRGGVFAALYGTIALLPEPLRKLVGGFVINKFRGDPALLGTGPAELERRCGVANLGVLPRVDGIGLDQEDSLALPPAGATPAGATPAGAGWSSSAGALLDVAVVRLPRISNFTDLDPLTLEPSVRIRYVEDVSGLGCPDLVVLPGSKSTVADLAWLEASGLAKAICDLVGGANSCVKTTVVGICGGYQMLGREISDPIESQVPTVVNGLGLLDSSTVFAAEKITEQRHGSALGHLLAGYHIHHGRTTGPKPWISLVRAETSSGQTSSGQTSSGQTSSGQGRPEQASLDGCSAEGEGCQSEDGRVLGTSLHGLWDSDGFRSAFLEMVAARAGKSWRPSGVSFAAKRSERFDRLADLLERHLDLDRLTALVASARSTCPEVNGARP